MAAWTQLSSVSLWWCGLCDQSLRPRGIKEVVVLVVKGMVVDCCSYVNTGTFLVADLHHDRPHASDFEASLSLSTTEECLQPAPLARLTLRSTQLRLTARPIPTCCAISRNLTNPLLPRVLPQRCIQSYTAGVYDIAQERHSSRNSWTQQPSNSDGIIRAPAACARTYRDEPASDHTASRRAVYMAPSRLSGQG